MIQEVYRSVDGSLNRLPKAGPVFMNPTCMWPGILRYLCRDSALRYIAYPVQVTGVIPTGGYDIRDSCSDRSRVYPAGIIHGSIYWERVSARSGPSIRIRMRDILRGNLIPGTPVPVVIC